MIAIRLLRIFDYAKAREFYMDWLGFQVDWEHQFAPGKYSGRIKYRIKNKE